MNVQIETDRTIIRDILPTDAEGMFLLDSDPEVHKYLGNAPIKSISEAKEVIEFIRTQYVSNGMGRLAIIDKKTEDFIGWTGIKYEDVVRIGQPYYDIGYRLRKEYWGKGIATETAIASMDLAFNTLNLPTVCGAADIDNIGSNRVLTKLGMKFVETFMFEDTLHNWYRIDKEQWLNN